MNEYYRNELTYQSAKVSNGSNPEKNLPQNNNRVESNDELSELRSLLLGVETAQLSKLYDRLENPQIQAEDLSRLLPEAVILRTMQDKQLAEAMVPTVEQAIQSSVKQDLNVLSEAFFPIIGPASRKAITTVLGEMIQSLNQTLEHSMSPQSFKWRLEARQTGKTFAEVVLLRTLIYRVEQVFLIHKQTGLLLQHILAPQVAAQDPDLVSAMLTAIQDFVKDSFNIEKGEALQSLQFGELSIWIEEGPQAILAGIIRGNAPQELRLVFQKAIENIHLKLHREFHVFTGETKLFTPSRPYLEECLEARYKVPSQKNYIYAWSFLSAIAIALGMWGFFSLREQLRWNAYLEKLNSQPGIIVIKANKGYGKNFISGMRDPLATDPYLLMNQAKINPQTVISKWEPYLSLEPQIIVKRAAELLQPPKTVSLKADKNRILYATGTAPRQWILEARKTWRFLPGVTQYIDKDIVESELQQLQLYKQQIEQEKILFLEGTTEFVPSEIAKLQNIVLAIKNLSSVAKTVGKDVRFEITGHTNFTGTEQRNMVLSQARASKILAYLNSQGINTSNFTTVGVGSSQPLQTGLTEQIQQVNRRVSFKVFLIDARN
ncbi:OmpA family protein [Fischerella thermalis]|uniref:OmpA family protein n=1 Tax=Fischerella thermalis TaxID=372787 RepID=UPI001A0BA921|nr:OmpA family protein [Fischerella thermalis]MBF2070507.1 OmpA family protein [Fischerella thermalis M48_A2018_028]